MQSFLPGRASRGPGAHPFFGLFIAGTVQVSVACGTDEPAPNNATLTNDTPDASLRDLPGDGLEPTPESNVSGPREQRPELIDALGSRDPRPPRPPQPDAAPPDAGDDASDASGSP